MEMFGVRSSIRAGASVRSSIADFLRHEDDGLNVSCDASHPACYQLGELPDTIGKDGRNKGVRYAL